MHDMIIEESSFSMAADFNPDSFFKHSIGITQLGNEPAHVTIRISNSQAAYLETQPIHSSQKIAREDDNTSIIELYVLLTYELKSFILGLGTNATVLSPKTLVAEIKKELASTVKNY